MMESKKQIYNLIPQKYYPKTELIPLGTSLENIKNIIESASITYPFIAKPDIGLRGSAVKKIETFSDLKQYAEKAHFDLLCKI